MPGPLGVNRPTIVSAVNHRDTVSLSILALYHMATPSFSEILAVGTTYVALSSPQTHSLQAFKGPIYSVLLPLPKILV